MNALIEGFRTTSLIAAAVKLGILDELKGKAMNPGELAEELGLKEAPLRRVLRGLAVLRIVDEEVPGAGKQNLFRLTGAGALLCSDSDSPHASYALLCQGQYEPAWSNLESAVRDGEIPFEKAFGEPVWEYRRGKPRAGALFNQWLHRHSSSFVEAIVKAIDLSSCRKVADVGGGRGVVLSGVLREFPGCRGVLADQPAVVEEARAYFRHCGLEDRCDFEAIDFFVSAPRGCDAYLLKSVLHDWDDAGCLRVLTTLHDTLARDVPLFVIEGVLPERAVENPDIVWLDLMMMTLTGGRERTLEEYRELLEHAGFRIRRVLPTGAQFQVLETVKR